MKRVLIVGGGASGVLIASNVARNARSQVLITIAEPREELGMGVAYSTNNPSHLLNVPASRMSMFVDEPDHFMKWGNFDKNAFAPRREYASYLNQNLRQHLATSTVVQLQHRREFVTDIESATNNWKATFSSGRAETFDAIVIAIGQGESVSLPNLVPGDPRYISDSWRQELPETQGTLLGIGTGLTFVDHALAHLRRDPSNRAIGISRNGLLPQPHLHHRADALSVPDEVKSSPDAVREFIENAEDWRAAQDGIRHELPEIWHRWNDEQKSTFLTRDLRWWNVHRHRLAPEIAEEIEREISSGRLRIMATEFESLSDSHGKLSAHFSIGESIEVDLVINCLGYLAPGKESLIGTMQRKGIAAQGPLGIGMKTNFPDFNVTSADGHIHESLYAIGPVLVGERFETTAIPELRHQAWEIAQHLL